MTREFVKTMRYDDLQQAYYAYGALMAIYENTCGGPRGAMAHKEYFALRDSRENIRAEVINRTNTQGNGNGQ